MTTQTLNPRYDVLPLNELKPHEQFVEERVQEVQARVEREQTVSHPIVVDAKTRVILDGHHRYETLRRLGVTLAPVAIVDYSDPRIAVESWDEAIPAPSKEDVVRHALAGKLFPPKSTRHPAFYDLPSRPMPLDRLRA